MKTGEVEILQTAALAKITRPAIGDVLIRERLFRQLDEARRKPVVCIASPAGSGKTTLVTGYLESRGLDCIWYQVDAGDADLATFFYYLGQAGKKASPRSRKPLPLFTPEYMDGIPEFSRNFFGDLFGRLKKPCFLIFDNYQDVDENAPLHAALVEGLTRLPEGVNLMLVSRSTEPPAYARLKANRSIGGVNWSDLRFTEEEFTDILEKRCRKKAPREVLRDIYQRLDGWVAGLHLIVESACPDHFEILRYIIEGTPAEVFDYFACEILERQDEETREFLTKTAFLPHTTTAMAQQLTGHPQAVRILSTLNKKNHFTEKRFQPHVSYHFHPLFREFLLQRASETYSLEDLIEVKRQAATILIKGNQPAAAVQLLREAEDWEGLANLIENEAQTLISQGRNLVLEAWIRSLPEDILTTRPWLLYWLGNALIMYDPHKSCDLLEKSFYIFRDSADFTNMFRAWAGLSDAIFYCLTGYQRYDTWLALFEELYEKYSSYITEDIDLQVTGGVLNAIILRQPYRPDYENWVQRAFALIEKSNDIPTQVHVLHILWISTMIRQDHIKGSNYIEVFQEFVELAEVTPWGVLLMLEDASFQYGLVGRFVDCRRAVTKGLEMADETGIHYLDHWFLGVAASASLSQGDIKEAEHYLDRMQAQMQTIRDWQKALYYLLASHRDILQGDLISAERNEKIARQCAIKTGAINPIMNHLKILLEWKNKRNYNKIKRAVPIILKLHRQHGLGGQLGFEVYLTQAYIALEHGDEATVLSSLKKGMAIGRKTGALNYWGWLPFVMARVCAKALEENIEVEYVRRLIRERKIIPEESPVTIENWPWPVRIYTLGRFEVVLDDRPLRFGRKAQQKPIDLIQVLVALGGRKIAETKIADILWPDDDGDMQIKSLHTTVYRLRKLLGYKDAIEYENNRLSLNDKICWIDVWSFERLLGEADSMLSGKPKARQVRQLKEKLFSLYQNAFLNQLTDRYWTIQLREKLKSKFLRAIEQLGSYYLKAGSHKEVIALHRKALEVDPLLESCYQQIMLSYIALDKTSEAANTFRTCARMLRNTLGVEPGEDTRKIYKKLGKAAKKS